MCKLVCTSDGKKRALLCPLFAFFFFFLLYFLPFLFFCFFFLLFARLRHQKGTSDSRFKWDVQNMCFVSVCHVWISWMQLCMTTDGFLYTNELFEYLLIFLDQTASHRNAKTQSVQLVGTEILSLSFTQPLPKIFTPVKSKSKHLSLSLSLSVCLSLCLSVSVFLHVPVQVYANVYTIFLRFILDVILSHIVWPFTFLIHLSLHLIFS